MATRISKFGPGVIGEEAARANRAKKKDRTQKFGPGVLGNPKATETLKDAPPPADDVADERSQRPEKVVLVPETFPDTPPPNEPAGMVDEAFPEGAETPQLEEPGETAPADGLPPKNAPDAPEIEPSTVSVETMRKALEANPATFDEFFLGELNRKPSPRKGALHVLLDAEKARKDGPRKEVTDMIEERLAPVEGG